MGLEDGRALLRRGLDAAAATGAGIMRPYFLGLLGDVDAETGRFVDAAAAFDEALALVEANEERYFEAELRRLRGEALLTGPEPDTAGAEGDFHRALELAESQGAAPLDKYVAGLGIGLGLGIFPIAGLGVLIGLAMYLPFSITLTYGIGCVIAMWLKRSMGTKWIGTTLVPVAAGFIIGEALTNLVATLITLAFGG